jgi:hypothetical protein
VATKNPVRKCATWHRRKIQQRCSAWLREAEIMKMTFEIPQEPEDRSFWGFHRERLERLEGLLGHHWAHEICQFSLVPNYDL